MIQFQDLSFYYPGAVNPALRDVNLEISAGEFILVAGASGAGKSTLLRCLNGLVPHFSGGELRGSIQVNSLDPVACSPKVMSRHVGFVFQDPETQFVLNHVEDDIAFSLENAAVPADIIRVQVEDILGRLDLNALRDRRIETLSGGERQRVAIAASLVGGQKILVLDEPTSQLDPGSAEDVLDTILRLKHELDLTVILSEHRLERVLPYADRIIYMEAGSQSVVFGAPQDVLPHMQFTPPVTTLALDLKWDPLPLSIGDAQAYLKRHPLDVPEHNSAQRPQSSGVPAEARGAEPEPLIQVSDLSVVYDDQSALKGVSLQVLPGEVLALMGSNGAGKTTLLRTLVGLQKADGGRVSVAGLDPAGCGVAEICKHVGYLPQDPNSLLFADRVYDELSVTLQNHGLAIDEAWIDGLLKQVKIDEYIDSYPRDLSVGQRQRVALCAIMVTRPVGLLLDEPTRGLDPITKRDLGQLLREWRVGGKGILLVTHDVEFAATIADRVVILEAGEIIDRGATYEVLSRSQKFAPQMVQLFPGRGWLTVGQALRSLRHQNRK